MNSLPPPKGFDENPEWTDADFARARPAGDALPVAAAAALVRGPGRPRGSTTSAKSQVTLRIDSDVLARFKATGAGWQSRINAALRSIAP